MPSFDTPSRSTSATPGAAAPGPGNDGRIVFEERLSDSSLVDRVWRSRSERAGPFQSIASAHWEMVVSRHGGRAFFTVRGPETRATAAELPAHGEWVAIRFRLGTFMPLLPPGALRDRNDVTLPDASGRAFWLRGSAWEHPGFENAETFVDRLERAGMVASEPAVESVLRGASSELRLRTEQRRFLRATGVTQGVARQIERARRATILLREGMSILDTTFSAGYYDQAHLTRSLRRFVGQTPAEVARGERQLSFLYKTEPD